MGALLLAGTTFAGHDWSTGSIVNQLIFEPRRRRMWLAKAVVVFLAGLIVALVALLAFWTVLWGIASHRGLSPAGSELASAYFGLFTIQGVVVA